MMKKITEKQFKHNVDAFLEQAIDEPIQIELDNNNYIFLQLIIYKSLIMNG